jgi:predicted transcriptional regulator
MNDKQTQTAIRLDDALLERVDKLAERMSQPGLRVTRVDVLRLTIFRGMAELEAAEKKKR